MGEWCERFKNDESDFDEINLVLGVTIRVQIIYHREPRYFTQSTTEWNYMNDNDITGKNQ